MKYRSGVSTAARRKARRKMLLLLTGVFAISTLLVYGLDSKFRGRTADTQKAPNFSRPAQVDDTATRTAAASNRNLPARIIIPRLKVDAVVGYVGLTKNGLMEAPKNIADTGWYKNGPLPGNTGSAVIAGHVNGVGGKPGVFAELSKLRAGDTVEVIDLNGMSAAFTVRTSKTYSQNEQPEEVFRSDSGTHLNLITCTGDWSNAERQFSQRLVVFTDKQ